MRGFVRWVLLLLVVCVPLRALAATCGVACPRGGLSHAMQGASPGPGASPHAHCEGHGQAAAHPDVGLLAEADALPAHLQADAAAAADELAAAGHGCGSCAPCCAAAAPAPEPPLAGSAAPAPVFAAHALWLATGVVADVPHRPPR